MTIAVISEGQAEYYTAAELLRRIVPNATVIPVKVNVDPVAPPGRLISPLAQAITIVIQSRAPDAIYVLLDLETLNECPGERAVNIQGALGAALSGAVPPIHVVIKHRKFENWLVSDIEAIKRQRARFDVSAATERAVSNNNADHSNAEDLIKRSIKNGQPGYSKVKDAQRIIALCNPCRMARNSRSFRRLMRLLGHQCYAGGSQGPNSACHH